MATLEKIRNQKKLLFIVIFGALLLFILSIIDNPGSIFKDTTTAAKVDGKKISIEDVQNLAQELQVQGQNQNQRGDVDYQYMALQQLIAEAILDNEYESLGITVTDAEINEVLMGENAMNIYMNNAAVKGLLDNFYETYQVAPQDMRQAIEMYDGQSLAPEQEQQVRMMKQIFAKLEKDLENTLLSIKLQRMLEGGINANKLDAQALYDEAVTTYVLATVSQPTGFGEPATDADIKNYYDAHREFYKIEEPKRLIRYAYTNIVPTPADRNAIVERAQQLAETVNDGTIDFNEAIATGNYALKHHVGNNDYVSAANERGLREFLDEAQPGDVRLLSPLTASSPNDPKVTVAQLVSKEVKQNGAQVLSVLLDGTVAPDSIVNQLNAGVDPNGMKGVATVFPGTKMTFQNLPDEIVDSLKTLGLGKYMAVGTADGSQRAIAFESYADPEEVYEYYTASLAVEPSQETRDALTSAMHEFLAAASTAEYFNDDNAIANGLTLHYGLVGPSDNLIAENDEYMPVANTTDVVAWAVDAEPGSVSKLFTTANGDRLLAAAVVEEYKDYIPATYPALATQLAMAAQEYRDANAIMESVTGKATTLDEYAKLFNAQRVDTIAGVNLSNPRFAGLGNLRGHKIGDVVGPMHWSGVTAAKILEANESAMPFNMESNAYTFRNTMLSVMFNAIGALDVIRGNNPIEYNYLRFSTHK